MRHPAFFSEKLIHEVNLKLIRDCNRYRNTLPPELEAVVSPYKKTPAQLREAFQKAALSLKQG